MLSFFKKMIKHRTGEISPAVEFPEKLNCSSVRVAPGIMHEEEGEGGGFQAHAMQKA